MMNNKSYYSTHSACTGYYVEDAQSFVLKIDLQNISYAATGNELAKKDISTQYHRRQADHLDREYFKIRELLSVLLETELC